MYRTACWNSHNICQYMANLWIYNLFNVWQSASNTEQQKAREIWQYECMCMVGTKLCRNTTNEITKSKTKVNATLLNPSLLVDFNHDHQVVWKCRLMHYFLHLYRRSAGEYILFWVSALPGLSITRKGIAHFPLTPVSTADQIQRRDMVLMFGNSRK